MIAAANQLSKGKFVKSFCELFYTQGALDERLKNATKNANDYLKTLNVYPKKLGQWPGQKVSQIKVPKGQKLIKFGAQGEKKKPNTIAGYHKAIQEILGTPPVSAKWLWKYYGAAVANQELTINSYYAVAVTVPAVNDLCFDYMQKIHRDPADDSISFYFTGKCWTVGVAGLAVKIGNDEGTCTYTVLGN